MSAEDQLPWEEFVALDRARRAAAARRSTRHWQGPPADSFQPTPADYVAQRTGPRTVAELEQHFGSASQRSYGRNPYPQRVCAGRTVQGEPCRSFARSDSAFCQMHDPLRAAELHEMRRQGAFASARSRALRDRCARLDSFSDLLRFNTEVLRGALDEEIPTPLARLLLAGVAQHRHLLRLVNAERELQADADADEPPAPPPNGGDAAPEAARHNLPGPQPRVPAADAEPSPPADDPDPEPDPREPEADPPLPFDDAPEPSLEDYSDPPPADDGQAEPDPEPADDVDVLAPPRAIASAADPLLAARLRARAKLYRDVLALQALDPEFLTSAPSPTGRGRG